MDDRASGLQRNADAIGEALERTPGDVVLLLEMTAGSGTVLGSTFEEMAALIDKIPLPHRERVGVCVDTAHIFAAGYDIANDYDGVWARFDDTIGRSRLRMMHLNDSKVPLGSKRDRHELIGEGAIGEGAFRRIMNDADVSSAVDATDRPDPLDAIRYAHFFGYHGIDHRYYQPRGFLSGSFKGRDLNAPLSTLRDVKLRLTRGGI